MDLDLPSGTLWATCNVGADSPEEYGLYFAWGETKGYTSDTSDGRSFDWESYKLYEGTDDTMTKYCTNRNYGTVDNKTTLDLEDDAAYVNWGSNWRMPTEDEMAELKENCDWTWTTQQGINGYKVSSKVNPSKSIFLPAAGYRYYVSIGNVGSGGLYWSSSLNSDYPRSAYYLIFFSYNVSRNYTHRRCGLTVRPVRAK